MKRLDAVLDLAEHGLAVFPVTPRDKRPLRKGWQQEATASRFALERKWRARSAADWNFGVATGRVSNLVVLDVDAEHLAAGALEELEKRGLPETATVETPGGGLHFYYRLPEDWEERFPSWKEDPYFEVKGCGAYVVAPPSVHPNGGRYRWRLSPTEVGIAPAPAWLLQEARRRRRRSSFGGAPAAEPAPLPLEAAQTEARRALEKALEHAAPGNRNNTGFWLARCLRDHAVPMEIAEGIMREYAQRAPQGDHPYTVREAMASLEQAYRAPAQRGIPIGTGPEASLTDTGFAELCVALFGEDVRYDHRRKRWLFWDGLRWNPDVDAEIDRRIIEVSRKAQERAKEIEDTGTRQQVRKWALAYEGARRREDAKKTLASLKPVALSGEEFDQNPWLLGTKNGTLDLRTGILREARREDYLSLCTGTAYDPEADCPRWIQFLEEVFQGSQELIEFVQRAVGYCLTGDISEHVFFLCHGTGCNGKSVFLNVLTALLGDYAATTPFSTFTVRRSEQTNDLAALCGKRFVSARETQENSRLDEGRIKAITGGDPITARFLRKEYFTFKPQGKLWLAVNHLPKLRDTSEGMWRRMRVIPFRESFRGREDKTLEARLREELPGILHWAVEGCQSWQDGGLCEPEEVLGATENYRQESDPVGRFLEEACVQFPHAKVRFSALYEAFERWCHETGEEPISRKAFSQQLSDRGIQKMRSHGTAYRTGVGLRAEWCSEDEGSM